ncbi:hypothetical protein OsI_28335 [Oryza sativa Indica Group]|uniref:Uncharacterized protein n=1 Tax=Oryza sativa subsp. indica TaxID=39946 RepID=B8BC67_ORYSI|nr:hypothetical protein OsI_28335 [Oryza sativa Indica Group]
MGDSLDPIARAVNAGQRPASNSDGDKRRVAADDGRGSGDGRPNIATLLANKLLATLCLPCHTYGKLSCGNVRQQSNRPLDSEKQLIGNQLLRIWKSWVSQLLTSSLFSGFYNYNFSESKPKAELFGELLILGEAGAARSSPKQAQEHNLNGKVTSLGFVCNKKA